jgi:hypothetical protein
MNGPRASGDVGSKSTGDLVRAYRSLRPMCRGSVGGRLSRIGQSSALQALDYRRPGRAVGVAPWTSTTVGSGPANSLVSPSMLARFGENLSMPAQRPGTVEPEGTAGAPASPGSSGNQWPDSTRRTPGGLGQPSAISRWLLQETLGGGWTGGGKSRVWFAPEGCVSSAALPSAVRWRQLVCQSGRSGLACSQSTKVASSQ